MMSRLSLRLFLATVLSLLLGVPALAQPAARAFVDGIAAVVNQKVITLHQLQAETAHIRNQMQNEKVPVPDEEPLQKQVLQRLITRELQEQEVERLGIVATEADVQLALETIAQRNELSVPQLRKEIESSGTPWERYLADIRQEVRFEMLRQREVDSTLFISDTDVDAFLRTQGNAAPASAMPGPSVLPPASHMALAQILVAVPERATSADHARLHQKAQSLLARAQAGEDFAGLAAAASDGPEALQGGVLGERPVEGWPDLFIDATRGLDEGGISDLVRSGVGYHILKVLALDRPAASPGAHPAPRPSAMAGMEAPPLPPGSALVTQTHARHILIKTSQIMSDDKARQQLELLRGRLQHGESFADLARRYSEDSSAPQGGDLGWLNPGETVAPFEHVMNALAPGEVSGPVQSSFGWHLIRVEERREKDLGDEYQRMWARQVLFQRRVEPAMEDWIAHLWSEAYIENRLDPSANRNRRAR